MVRPVCFGMVVWILGGLWWCSGVVFGVFVSCFWCRGVVFPVVECFEVDGDVCECGGDESVCVGC